MVSVCFLRDFTDDIIAFNSNSVTSVNKENRSYDTIEP